MNESSHHISSQRQATTILASLSLCFYSFCTFLSLIEIMYYCISVFMVASLIYISVILLDIRNISVHFFIISPLSYRAENNPDQILLQTFSLLVGLPSKITKFLYFHTSRHKKPGSSFQLPFFFNQFS